MYDIIEHRHRLAVWGAGRAYSRQGPGHTIAVARQLIENSKLSDINSPDDLPAADQMDAFIHERIHQVMAASLPIRYTNKDKQVVPLQCTYGRAQKLVNMYLKLKIVCAGFETHEKVHALHPPLDKVLLDALFASKKVDCPDDLAKFQTALETAKQMGKAWTVFDRQTYDAYIAAIKVFQGKQPLWAAERLWNPERVKVAD